MLHPPKGKLLQAPTGILLYGPPGCGKTMLAKALAKEAHLRFLVLPISLVLDKWVGETEKYLEALFTLARKIKPCVIFLDEVDALTRKRCPMDRDWNLTMKSHLLTLWDGLLSSDLNSQIIVNRNYALFRHAFRLSALLIESRILMKPSSVECHCKSKFPFPT